MKCFLNICIFMLFCMSGCEPTCTKDATDHISPAQEFVISQNYDMRNQLGSMILNQVNYLDSLTLKQVIKSTDAESLLNFRQDILQFREFLIGWQARLIAESENISISAADTIYRNQIESCFDSIIVPIDSIRIVHDRMWELQSKASSLPCYTGLGHSKFQPFDWWSYEDQKIHWWGEYFNPKITLCSALEIIDQLILDSYSFELEVLLRVRAGVDKTSWKE